MTIKVPPREPQRQYPLGDHPLLITEGVLACVIAGLVDGLTYGATPLAIVLVVVLAAAMAAVGVLGLRTRYVRKAAHPRAGRANTKGVVGDA